MLSSAHKHHNPTQRRQHRDVASSTTTAWMFTARRVKSRETSRSAVDVVTIAMQTPSHRFPAFAFARTMAMTLARPINRPNYQEVFP